MGVGWIKRLALPVLLLTLLAACQPYDRNHARTAGLSYSPGYGQKPGYGGCGYGYNPCKPRPVCPPGYVLARIPYSYGGPGRYCKPYGRRCCGPPPPPCGWQAPCGYGGGRPYAAY